MGRPVRRTQLSYLTGGLSWSAEHVLVRTGEGDGHLVDAREHRQHHRPHVRERGAQARRRRAAACRVASPNRSLRRVALTKTLEEVDLSEQSFSEYHLYTLDRPATVRDKEAQQLTMLEPRKVKLAPRYFYRGQEGTAVRAQLELVNDDANGLGVPLPAGRVRVFEAGAQGDLRFWGATILHPERRKLARHRHGVRCRRRARETFNKRISDPA